MTKVKTIMLALLALVALPSLAMAFQPYEKASFDKLLKSGKPVVVQVHADW
jgi:thioredoxin 1